ncbi:MAG: hypothetical protein IJW16_02570 [Clostridia bacterium]|nr:hypothetical protein [Clostridia bacterium]
MEMRRTGEDAYFAASNSAFGFYSYYPQCFDDARIKRVYAIKGGPGTGKSRFMREVAQDTERRGGRCEYIYCSSDADSLDGVILTRGTECVALLDATAPHVYEPTSPGVREELVDLGAFWSSENLRSHAREIALWNGEKKKAYKMAYRYLAAYGEVSANRDDLIAPYIRYSAMEQYAEKLLWDVPNGKCAREQPALIRSIGMKGKVALDTYFATADRILLVEDCRGSAQYLMRMLWQIAERKRLQMRLSHDPILPERIDGIFLCESKIAIVVGRAEECVYPYRRVGTRRFVDTASMKHIRRSLNRTEQLCRSLVHGAEEALARVREVHFALEEVYIAAMDFSAKEEYTKRFCDRLFDLK